MPPWPFLVGDGTHICPQPFIWCEICHELVCRHSDSRSSSSLFSKMVLCMLRVRTKRQLLGRTEKHQCQAGAAVKSEVCLLGGLIQLHVQDLLA